MKRIAISQSNYIPWKGYFDLINSVDEFVLYDTVQYTKSDWRNRNRVKTGSGLKWLTIPVDTTGHFGQTIADVQVTDRLWTRRHWQTWQINYARAAYFRSFSDELRALYLDCGDCRLSAINRRFLDALCRWLGIRTKVSWSTEYPHAGERSARVLQICLQAGASHYVSGPAAKAYLDTSMFERAGITVEWMNYDGYRPYRQLHGAFEHRVSALDLILNEGPNARLYLQSSHLKK